ncbi:glycosyltransferase [Enteractinococcus coprophilus]|uniref:glycosyltransferase n=1 Tax=Enteractinococcus coprophilus TaxID=1027633 RepID=UPI001476A641|nr:glycosyltransferase [Enteractinococcus coprophilus]
MGLDNERPYEPDMIFLGGMFPQASADWIQRNSKGNIHNAANVMQWNLVRGLASHLGSKLNVVSSPFLGSFPKYFKKIRVPDFQLEIVSGAGGQGIGFLNLPGVKHVSRYFRLRRTLSAAIQTARPPHAVIAYSFSAVMAFSLRRVKRLDPTIVTCLVVPDLPGFMNLSAKRSLPRKMLGKLLIKRLYKTLEDVDCAVVLTEPMVSYMGFTKPHVVIEGIAPPSDAPDLDQSSTESPASSDTMIVYTGGLNAAFGVLELVQAFSTLTDPSLRLVLCGVGDAVQAIEEYATSDQRIIYQGLLPHKEVVALQRQATVLVNPRQNTEEYVKYSFPSKLMEYMVSGTPTVAYDLDGMPAEYREHLFIVPENDIASLAKTIQQVLAQSPAQRRDFGHRARTFVQEQKNPEVQTKKILRMIDAVTTQRKERYGRV